MTTPVIIDTIAAVLFVGLILYGTVRGLVKAVLGVVVVIAAILIAGQVSDRLMDPVSDFAATVIEERLEQRMEKEAERAGDEAQASLSDAASSAASSAAENVPESVGGFDLSGLSLPDFNGLMDRLQEEGESSGLLDRLKEAASDLTGGIREKLTVNLHDVIKEAIRPMVRSVLYAVCAFLVMTVLKLLVRPLYAVAELPGVAQFNRAGGALLGLIEACLVLAVALWLVTRAGLGFDTPPLSETVFLRTLADLPPFIGILS